MRPFGISVLFAGFDESGPHLYQIDPSGAYYEWKATAIGRNAKNAKNFLEKRYNKDMEIEDVHFYISRQYIQPYSLSKKALMDK